MANVSYAKMKLKTDLSVNSFEYEGQTVEVLKYLPITDKYDMIMIALEKSKEDDSYNALKLDVYLHLYLVYLYTNITFTDKQKEDEFHLFDTIKSNGLLDLILDNIEEEEYQDIMGYVEDIMAQRLEYGNTLAAIVRKFIDDLPAQAKAAMDIVESFDPEKYQNVLDFAKAANGGRNIQ